MQRGVAELPAGAGLQLLVAFQLPQGRHVMSGVDSAMNGSVTADAASRDTVAS